MYQNGAHLEKSLTKGYALYSIARSIIQAAPEKTSSVTEPDILDSITTLKAQMTPSEIAAGEAEIPKVMQEYGIVL